MNIIISPAKKMRVQTDMIGIEDTSAPAFLKEAETLKHILSGYDRERLKKLYKANDSITELNYHRLREMETVRGQTPAVLAYVGLQYQSMAPEVFTERQWNYVREHLYIVSGLYGLLRALDGVVCYRLEMQAALAAEGAGNLYEFWGDKICRALTQNREPVLNLASKEYSKAVEPYMDPGLPFVTCVFAADAGGRPKVKATEAKMARGDMVRWLAENRIVRPEGAKKYSGLGYRFCEERSTDREYIFLKADRRRDFS